LRERATGRFGGSAAASIVGSSTTGVGASTMGAGTGNGSIRAAFLRLEVARPGDGAEAGSV
jgi:hypothetical protein